jgi:hypothetical protein
MTRLPSIIAGALLALSIGPRAWATTASATDAPDFGDSRRGYLGLSFGFASPVGELGAAFAWRPARGLALEADVGVGMTGFQLSLLPKIIVGQRSSSTRFTLAAGPTLSVTADATRRLWTAFELGVEAHRRDGFLGVSCGLAILATGTVAPWTDGWFGSSEPPNGPGEPYLSLRITKGLWF